MRIPVSVFGLFSFSYEDCVSMYHFLAPAIFTGEKLELMKWLIFVLLEGDYSVIAR